MNLKIYRKLNHTHRTGGLKMIELGDRVKDRITGLKGIAVGISKYLYGCTRIAVQPEEAKDGKPAEWFHVDEPQLELMKKSVVSGRETPTHGPRENILLRKESFR